MQDTIRIDSHTGEINIIFSHIQAVAIKKGEAGESSSVLIYGPRGLETTTYLTLAELGDFEAQLNGLIASRPNMSFDSLRGQGRVKIFAGSVYSYKASSTHGNGKLDMVEVQLESGENLSLDVILEDFKHSLAIAEQTAVSYQRRSSGGAAR
jgi:hypothetical protein